MSAMNAEFFDAIEQIEKEKGIPRGYMQEKIQQALLTAFKRDNPDCEDNVEVIMDENKKTISMFVLKTIVEESEYVNDATQILLDEAHHYDKKAGIGDTVRIMETRPLSKMKRWRLLKIVERRPNSLSAPARGLLIRKVGTSHDSDAIHARRGRQLRRSQGAVHQGSRWLQAPLREPR